MLSKKELRQKMLHLRAEMDQYSKSIYDHQMHSILIDLIKEKEYRIVHCYISMTEEFSTWPVLEYCLSNGIKVYAPKTLKKRQLQHLELKSLDDLERGLYGTFHPKNDNSYEGNFDLIIVPGLAFDKQGNRLGYGGGYYDQFLSTQAKAIKLGVFYPFQEVLKVPVETYDVTLDLIMVDRDFVF